LDSNQFLATEVTLPVASATVNPLTLRSRLHNLIFADNRTREQGESMATVKNCSKRMNVARKELISLAIYQTVVRPDSPKFSLLTVCQTVTRPASPKLPHLTVCQTVTSPANPKFTLLTVCQTFTPANPRG